MIFSLAWVYRRWLAITFLAFIMGSNPLVMHPTLWAQAKQDANRQYPPVFEGAKEHVYKTIDGTDLKLYVFQPKDHQVSDRRPAVVFFFGGGWTSGSPQQFEQQCRYLASRGMIAITADYRVASRQKVKAVECVKDAKSAVRWVRQHANELGIDTQRIAAGGGSAGGHIAACTATIKDFDDPKEDPSISSVPNALLLYNPAAALAQFPSVPDVAAQRVESLPARLGVDPKALSPAHHVATGLPATIIFFGTEDGLLAGAKYFKEQADKVGARCELITYEGQTHGFFNFNRGNAEYFKKTLTETDKFLVSLGWIQGDATVDQFKWSEASTRKPAARNKK